MITIRKATIFDHGNILLLLHHWLKEAEILGNNGYTVSASVWLAELTVNPENIVLLAEIDNKLVGCLALTKTQLPWNDKFDFLVNDFFMTSKEDRDKGVASEMIIAMKAVADERKMPVIISHISGIDATLKDKYLKISGFEYLGGNFIYRGN